VHAHSATRLALQLGHSGRKGSTRVMWEGENQPLPDGNWPLLSPSAIPWSAGNQVPRAMTRTDMERVRDEFAAAAERGARAGFDAVEIHCAHGYLLSSFLSPVTNQRTDAFGGSLENRLRFPLEVFEAVRAVWPSGLPAGVRISATDWVAGGITLEDSVEIARAFKSRGADFIDVSTGQVSPDQQPVYGRMFQVPYAERIRLEIGMATLAVGNITEPDQVNSIVAAGRADVCLLARPHLWDPMWTLRAAAEAGYEGASWPPQYQSARRQLETRAQRARDAHVGPI
jgi:anthraniloyl-CoA monooxygenase